MTYNLKNFLEDFKRDLKPCPWYGYNCSIKKKFIKLLDKELSFTITNKDGNIFKYSSDKLDFTSPVILSDNSFRIIFLTDENQESYYHSDADFIKTLIVIGNISNLKKPISLIGLGGITDLQIILPNLKSTGNYIVQRSDSLLQVEFCVPSLIKLGSSITHSFFLDCPKLTFCIFDAPKLVFRPHNISRVSSPKLIYFKHNCKSTIADVNNCTSFDDFITLTKEKKDICEYLNKNYINISTLGLSVKNLNVITDVKNKYHSTIGRPTLKKEELPKTFPRQYVDPNKFNFLINENKDPIPYDNSLNVAGGTNANKKSKKKSIKGVKKSSTKKGAGKKSKKKSIKGERKAKNKRK